MPAPIVVLIGPPGSGKTAVAVALAGLLNVVARDTDDDVVATDGRDIPTIFVEDGESAFRARERAAVAEGLRGHPGVLALGGGAILDPSTRADLESYAAHGGTVVYLAVTAGVAAERVGIGGARPLLVGSPHRQWVTLMEQRRATYESLASFTVETDEATPAEVAATIVEEMGARCPSE